jgi:hypothetical protein
LAENGLTGNSSQGDILNVIMEKQNWYDFVLPAICSGLSWNFVANSQIFLEKVRKRGIDTSQIFAEINMGDKIDQKGQNFDEKSRRFVKEVMVNVRKNAKRKMRA